MKGLKFLLAQGLSLFVLGLATLGLQAKDMSSLVSAEWLAKHIDDKNIVVIDSTVLVEMTKQGSLINKSGRERYQQAHIPGAVFGDLKQALAADHPTLENVMPTPRQFAEQIGKLGVNNQSKVVIYSTDNHVWAARLWWMFRWAGHKQVAILDGGLNAWKAKGYALSDKNVSPKPQTFDIALEPQRVSSQQAVKDAITDRQVVIVDSLPLGHYQGQFSLFSRKGHIPTAVNLSSSDVLDDDGQYLAGDLIELLVEADKSQPIITYCGGGVAASGVAFALERAGFTSVSVYMGSLQEWTLDPNNPMVVDDQ
ncbi:MAG: sulfurtransferase [Kangiellaceae bacterium]|jgi:thiosulfate/3-mercaptopyruvate sulfurtransferase|nr:sulfurtransferase [Kangiellaceae bacterium]